jgi:catechol 2,3-dioxygenase
MPITAVQASTYLHHLHLHSPDPERLTAFYSNAMEMTVSGVGADSWLVQGPSRRLLISCGPARRLAHAAFAVRDAEGLAALRAHVERIPTRLASRVDLPLFMGGKAPCSNLASTPRR